MSKKTSPLRVLGTSVTLIEKIRKQAEKELNIEIEFDVRGVKDAERIAVMQPQSYDIYDQWFHNVDFVWPAQAIQPIDIDRIDNWSQVNSLPKTGRVIPSQPLAPGSEPSGRLYVQHNGTLGATPTQQISMLPLAHNVDSFAYNAAQLPEALKGQPESWAWLLSPAMKGRSAFQDDAAMGTIDAAIAINAAGLAEFKNPSNLTLSEIDLLIKLLKGKKDQGQFVEFWKDHEQSVNLLKSQRSYIQSIWAPMYYSNRCNIDGYKLACPIEGYRAWCGGLSVSKCASGKKLDMVYQYLNWWLSGWPGSVIAKQGYYISNTESVKNYLSEEEWQFWYEGKPALKVLNGIDDHPLIPEGTVRSGGSYTQRMSNIAVWNSVMDEHNYLVRKWRELTKV
ncbi:ABC transporter substrate-binding protein [Neptunomonas phycophila]|jgi:putative spermidine/putrescine transport system substrate-binding protein|uniref:ABC transporter substrate-binding protein n=1 Tax=Neptunomonas phycophila TaxID=1572645 RepID=UPI0009490FA0|nr:extracellular solute-binding protein [Neptunomonas phycophila]MBT3146346.1 signal peptide prediction [Neptunomonas phycophila]